MQLKGTVKKSNISGTTWELVSDDGGRFQLIGGDDALYIDGQRATVEGEVETEMMGIGMTGGGIFKVKSWRKG